jgi:hypothetical protein
MQTKREGHKNLCKPLRGLSLSIYIKYYGGAKNFSATEREGPLKNMQIKIKMHQPSPL